MGIVDLIFPKVCVGCSREGDYICKLCFLKIHQPVQICPICCKPSVDGWTHTRCKKSKGLDRLIIGLPYKGMVQDCLKKVKYRSAWDIIEFLYNKSDFVGLDDSIVTAVPMWEGKERTRGFNQAELFTQLISKQFNNNSLKLLERVRDTKPMFGLDKKERADNVRGSFQVTDKNSVKNLDKKILLVDDVWTTGATMRECATILKQSGAKEIWGVALAW